MQQLVASTGSTGGRARPVATSRATFTRSHAASRNVLEMGEVGSTSTRMLSMHQSQPCAPPEQGRHPGTDSARGREKYPSWSVLMIRGIASRNHRHAPPDQRRALRCFRDPTSSPLRQHPSTSCFFFGLNLTKSTRLLNRNSRFRETFVYTLILAAWGRTIGSRQAAVCWARMHTFGAMHPH